MNWREFVAGYLSFTRRDRIGILVLLSLIVLVFFLPGFFPKNNNRLPAGQDTAWMAALKKIETRQAAGNEEQDRDENPAAYQYDRSQNSSPGRGELFYFDPNTLTAEGWQKLGIRDKTIQTILNYRGKGGQFRKPEDLQRIYGLRAEEYKRIASFIRIEEKPAPVFPSSGSAPARNTPRTYSPVDINTADTSALIALPGIGSKLAARIVNFREKLGGFYSVDQVAETYGLPDSTFQKVKPYLQLNNPSVKRININTATVEELKAHPYIRYSIANPLIAYRKEHGPFSKVEDIRKVAAVTEEVYKKIEPYLTIVVP